MAGGPSQGRGGSHLAPLPRTPASLPLLVHSPAVLTLPLSFTSHLLSWRLGVSGLPLQELGGTGCETHAVASGVTVAQGEGREWVSVVISDALLVERTGLLLALWMAGPGDPCRRATHAALGGHLDWSLQKLLSGSGPRGAQADTWEARLRQAAL